MFICNWLVNNFTLGFQLSVQVRLFKITSMSFLLWLFLGPVCNSHIKLRKVCQCYSLLHSKLYSYSSLLIQWPVCTHELLHSIQQECEWVSLDLFICDTVYCCKENVVTQLKLEHHQFHMKSSFTARHSSELFFCTGAACGNRILRESKNLGRPWHRFWGRQDTTLNSRQWQLA